MNPIAIIHDFEITLDKLFGIYQTEKSLVRNIPLSTESDFLHEYLDRHAC
jgi:hypothetical protein